MSLLETQKLKAALSSERQVATRKTSDKASDSHRALDSRGGLRRANSSAKVGTWSTRGSRDVTWTPGVPAVEERASACRAAKRSAARRPCSSPHHHHLPAIAAFAHSVCQTEILPKLVFFFFLTSPKSLLEILPLRKVLQFSQSLPGGRTTTELVHNFILASLMNAFMELWWSS